MVNADDAAQSIGLSTKRAGPSNDKIWHRTPKASSFGCFCLMPPRTRFEAVHSALIRIARFLLIRLEPHCTGPRLSRQPRAPIRIAFFQNAENRNSYTKNSAQPVPLSAFPITDFYLATPKRSRHSTVQ